MRTHLDPKHVLSAVLAAAAFSVAASPAAAATALHVIPFPGTPDASTASDVIFSSLHRSDLASVIVAGSLSGQHTGKLISLPDGAGTAFVPAARFTAGEQVSVTANLRSPAAGTASGDPGATVLRFSFSIAVPAGSSAGGPGPSTPRASASATSRAPEPALSFHSAPGLHPPPVDVTSDPDGSSGDIFLTPVHAQQNGVMILNAAGRLVWFHPVSGFVANLEVQDYQHRPVLTWWQGRSLGDGEGVIMDRSYRVMKVVHAGDGYVADVHEFQLTRRGTAFIDASVPVKGDLTTVGGSSTGNLWDYVIQEVGIKTGQVLWEWHALGHVPVAATYNKPVGWPPLDYFHLNSIQQLPGGNLIVSARNTWGVYEINKRTGHVIWTLGGRYSNFKMGPGTNFEWQHDARLTGDTLTLFDDAGLPQEERQSSAKTLRIDTRTMRASLVHRYIHAPPLLSGSAGSAQDLPDHHVFVGWGNQPDFSEYSLGGKQIFAGRLPATERSYRAFRFPWNGLPASRPALAVSPQPGGHLLVYASWNGATQVASWRVLGGSRPTKLRALADAPWRGFETTISVVHQPHYVAVQALSARGKVLGTSAPHRL